VDLPLPIVAAWLLLAATVISVVYELWRATARAGVGPNDSMADWLKGLPLYAGALVVVLLLLAGWELAPVLGLAYGVLASLASILWYGPTILCGRRPGIIDWVEDRVFTMLVAIVAVLLAFDLLGVSLVA
jgi:phosphatidylserine synthase